MKASLNEVFNTYDHVISQVVKSKFVICGICDVTGIGCLSFGTCKAVEYYTYGKSHKSEYLAHPFRVTVCQVIVYCNYMNSLSLKGIEVCGHNCHEGLTFTSFHLGDTSLMKDDASDELNSEGFHLSYSPCSLSYCCKSLRKKVIQSFSLSEPVFKFYCFCLKLFIGKRLHCAVITFDFIYNRVYLL